MNKQMLTDSKLHVSSRCKVYQNKIAIDWNVIMKLTKRTG